MLQHSNRPSMQYGQKHTQPAREKVIHESDFNQLFTCLIFIHFSPIELKLVVYRNYIRILKWRLD